MPTLAECRAAGIPMFRFGSPELAALHERALGRPEFVAVGSKNVIRREYGWWCDGFQYVVNHGDFFTLNTIRRGQVVPESIDIK
jgi:hypothetical protein